MKSSLKSLIAAGAAAALVSGCGINPFGGSSAGLSMFAKIGKAIEKPSQIDKEESGKSGSRAMVSEGTAAAKRLVLGKSLAGSADSIWLDTAYIEKVPGSNSFAYVEKVTNKLSDDTYKRYTGMGKVTFNYLGNPATLDLSTVVGSNITDIISWEILGHELKLWNLQTDSMHITVVFAATSISDPKPGETNFWAKNISGLVELGDGDTGSFVLNALDEATSIQSGEGHFFDAHTGADQAGDSYAFDFTVAVDHNHTYTNYDDNKGTMNFYLPWWGSRSNDSLYFSVNFMPAYERSGTIRKNSPTGPILVEFTGNERTDIWTVTYYNENGDVINHE